MQVSPALNTADRVNALTLGNNHGYRLDGDTAVLNAELAVDPSRLDASVSWALQLWACDAPYQGGPLRGIKVAEAELQLPREPDSAPRHLEAEAFARVPPKPGEYAMVLVLASGRSGSYDQVHDFSNYASRQHFDGPHLAGSVGYRIDGDALVLQAERINNPRARDNLSGTLVLELWALPAPYAGEALEAHASGGTLLGRADLGRLSGEQSREDAEYRVLLQRAPVGTWHLALVLREWTLAASYVTRDYCNFSASYEVASLGAANGVEGADVSAPQSASAPSAAIDWAATRIANEASTSPAALRSVPSAAAPSASVAAIAAPSTSVATSAVSSASAPVVAAPTASAAVAASARTAVATSAPAVSVPTASAASASQVAHSEAKRVSIQHASVQDLAAIEGLNKKLAEAIVRARPFSSLSELKRVRGIGEKLLQRLRNQLTV